LSRLLNKLHRRLRGMGEAATPPNPSSPTEKALPRCPECGEELDYLECYTTAKYEYDGEEFEYIEMADGWEEYGDYLFVCPECGAELAWSVEEATAILKPKEGT